MTDYDLAQFDVVWLARSTTHGSDDYRVAHAHPQCRYRQDAKCMNPWDPRSLYDSTRLCTECKRLIEAEVPHTGGDDE